MRIVRFDNPEEDWMPFKKDEDLLWIGHIGNMPGHAAVATPDGKIIWGWHTDRFIPDFKEEPNMDIKLVKRKADSYPIEASQIFLYLGKIDNTDLCAIVDQKGKVNWHASADNYEDYSVELDE